MALLNVLYQFDENYAPYAGVSMTTLFENSKDIEELTVYLATEKVSEENTKKLAQLAQSYGRTLVYLDTSMIYDRIKKVGVNSWNGSLATWMKMFVMGSVPDCVDQLLYIDSDTLIPGSLRELAELDLGDAPVAAVIDSSSRTSRERLHMKTPYCNAGVIYFNLKYWRAHDTERKMLEHLQKHVAEYPVNDQDLLNDFFRNQIYILPLRFNFQGMHFFYKDSVYFPVFGWEKGMYYTPEQIEAARRNTGIIHFFRFCGEYPWEEENIHACRGLYEQALEKSLWAGHRCPKKKLAPVYRVEKILYRVLPQKLFLKILLVVK